MAYSMHSHTNSYKLGERGALISIAFNIVLFCFKFFCGIVGRSTAIVADALHTASDLLTSMVVFVGFKIAQQPPDSQHPYGHGRAESIAAKIVSLILIALGIKVFMNSVHVISSHEIEMPGPIALVAAVVSIVVKYMLYFYTRTLGRKIGSSSLTADAYHHQSDALSSIAALAGVWLARMGFKFMDPAAGILVAGLIIKLGISNFNTAYHELMDAAPDAELRKEIEKIIFGTEGVMAIKELNVRKLGIDLRVDLTIDVNKAITVEQGHLITTKVKRNIMDEMPHVKGILIHVEPFLGDVKA